MDLSDVGELIDSAIEQEKTPANLKDGGYIRSGFNAKLDELRDIKDHGKDIILKIEARERDATGIRTLRIGYNRVFGYYIEVSKSFKDKVPMSYQRRQTLANSERYTPTSSRRSRKRSCRARTARSGWKRSCTSRLRQCLPQT